MRWLLIGAMLSLAGCKDQRAPAPTAISPSSSAPTVDASAGTSPFEVVSFPSGARTLSGFLWLPKGSEPHRAVIFNHGSEREPSNAHLLARFYNEHGFVFFVPVRRGHGKSEGRYISDLRQEASGSEAKEKVVVDELVTQVDDVLAGLAYLTARSDVRKDAVALTGCSYGGIEVVLTAERASAFKVAIDFAGGAMSWQGSPLLRERMVQAVDRATIPIFFVQAANDFDTTPSTVLANEMDRLKKPNQRTIYPPRGSTPEEGHGLCRSADTWGPDVLAWIDRAMP